MGHQSMLDLKEKEGLFFITASKLAMLRWWRCFLKIRLNFLVAINIGG